MLKVLHHNDCSKSRAILEYLDENNVQFEIIDIINNTLSENEIRTLLKKLGLSAEELVRKNEPLFLEKFSGTAFTEDDWIVLLHKHPQLIQRPILIKEMVAMIGRPIENVKFFIEK